MNFEKLTEKSIESINHAQELSRDRRNPEITEMHLLHALLDERDDLNFQLFTSMGKDAQAMLADIDAEIAKLPTLGNGEAGKYMTSDLGSALSQAEEEAKRIGEKYIALVDHCLQTTGNLWEKYNVVDGNVEVVDEYKMPAMLGWTFGVYYWFCRLLGKEL